MEVRQKVTAGLENRDDSDVWNTKSGYDRHDLVGQMRSCTKLDTTMHLEFCPAVAKPALGIAGVALPAGEVERKRYVSLVACGRQNRAGS